MSPSNPATTHANAGIAAWRFKLAAEIHSYEDCQRFFRDWQNGTSKPLGSNMTVVIRGQWYAVKLYDTEIIRYYPDGTFSVDNGGWNTPTTSARLNAVLPANFSVYHKAKKFMLRTDNVEIWPADHSKRINLDGEVVDR